VQGTLTGEYHLYGPYRGPFGFGTLTIENGAAYGEPFEIASGSLRFEGNGVRIDGIQLRKSGGRLKAPRSLDGTEPTPSTRAGAGSRWKA
jgi:hypothetical protein